MDSFRIAAFGEVLLRLSPPAKRRFAQTIPGSLDAFFGGAEANVCAALSILGAKNRMLTAMPSNQIAMACVQQLRGLGTDVDHIMFKQSGRLGIYFAEQGVMQHSSGVLYDRENSVIAVSAPEEYDFHSMLEGCTHLLISGITPGISRNGYLSTMKIVEQAVEMGITVCGDVNYRGKLWKWDSSKHGKQLARECISNILENAGLIISSMGELDDVFGLTVPSEMKNRPMLEQITWAAEQTCKLFPNAKYIAIPLRDSFSAECINWGGLLYDCAERKGFIAPVNERNEYAPYILEHVVDSFGGGDAFTAGMIYALQSSDWRKPADAVRFATAFSCLKHTHPGDFSYTEMEDVISLLGGGGKGNIKR